MGVAGDDRLIHRGRKFDLVGVSYPMPDGRTVEQTILRHPGAVAVLPLLTDAEGLKIVLIRNFRPAVDEALLEIPAGTLEPDEAPDECARRELIEESGYSAARMEPLGVFFTTPGITDEQMHAFVARDLTSVGQQLDEGEIIDVEPHPAADVLAMIRRGEIKDGKTAHTILLAASLGAFDDAGGAAS